MDTLVDFIAKHQFYFYILPLILIGLKLIAVAIDSGLSLSATVISLFTIYPFEAIESSRRKWFMLLNNLLNLMLYATVFILILFVVITMHAGLG